MNGVGPSAQLVASVHDERNLARPAGAWPLSANPFMVKYWPLILTEINIPKLLGKSL
ncbi:hypothetical protein NXC24_PB00403 (plasmid) [Rhizobium sp. NXC24]|nr:hypothetical protein NXC24_PB00403 [Rhizobium sp. NXC24]